MAYSYPPIFINDYLAEKIPAALGPERFSGGLMRFFPTAPTDLDALTETFPEASANVFAVYDRMFKMRRKTLPHIKDEQLLYYFYKMHSDPVALILATQVVQDLLDRGDESAEEINSWIANNPRMFVRPDGQKVYQPTNSGSVYDINLDEYLPVYFHDIKIFQLEETRDIIDFGTARTYAGNKIIIDYRYHTKGYSAGNSTYNDTTL